MINFVDPRLLKLIFVSFVTLSAVACDNSSESNRKQMVFADNYVHEQARLFFEKRLVEEGISIEKSGDWILFNPDDSEKVGQISYEVLQTFYPRYSLVDLEYEEAKRFQMEMNTRNVEIRVFQLGDLYSTAWNEADNDKVHQYLDLEAERITQEFREKTLKMAEEMENEN